jgi:hypothetical protein
MAWVAFANLRMLKPYDGKRHLRFSEPNRDSEVSDVPSTSEVKRFGNHR